MNIMGKNCRDFRVAALVRGALIIVMAALFLGIFNGAGLAEPVWENGEYHIYTSADLKVMADWVNNSTVSRDAKYRLMEDIDLGGMDVHWLPLGLNENIFFNGEFNGGGHAIRDFVISRDANYVGLFGIISNDAKISDLKVMSFDVRGNTGVGGLVGYSEGTISTTYARGAVNGIEAIGGLVGYNLGTINTSYASGAVSGDIGVGGLVGYSEGTINIGYASGAVSGAGIYSGGLVGYSIGTINTSYASGAVSGYNCVGGLVGLNDAGGIINTSYASGTITGNKYVGGLVGGSGVGAIITSYASGVVSGDVAVGGLAGASENSAISTSYSSGAVSGNNQTGGLVGWNLGGAISTSYASGAVSGSTRVGGLVGDNDDGGTISTSYASGAVSGYTGVGGLVGSNFGTINPSYWLQDAPANINTGLKGVGSDNNVISTHVTSLDIAGMANRASFNAASWKFYGDPVVIKTDWCYTSFDNCVAPALFAFFDPASAPDFNVISGNHFHIIPQSAELRAGEMKQLQISTPGFKDLAVQGFNLSAPGLSGDKITIEMPEMYKAVLSIDERGVITVSADSTLFRNSNIESLIISVDHKIGGYPQLQKSFSLFVMPDAAINRSDIR